MATGVRMGLEFPTHCYAQEQLGLLLVVVQSEKKMITMHLLDNGHPLKKVPIQALPSFA